MIRFRDETKMSAVDKVDIQHDDTTVCPVFQNVSNECRLNVIMSLLVFSCYRSMWEQRNACAFSLYHTRHTWRGDDKIVSTRGGISEIWSYFGHTLFFY